MRCAYRWRAPRARMPSPSHPPRRSRSRCAPAGGGGPGGGDAARGANPLSSGCGGLRADEPAPDRAEYLARFRGALVLAPYAREQFAGQVSGVGLDSPLPGTPVIATRGTWTGAQGERFGGELTIAEG